MKKLTNYHKIRTIRISEKVFNALKKKKKRGQAWNLFLKELLKQ